MVRVRPQHYTFEVINKVRQFENLAKSAKEAPQKIVLRRMPNSGKKGRNNRSFEIEVMPNTRQQEIVRKESAATDATAVTDNLPPPPLPPRAEPVVPMPGGSKATPQKRKGDSLTAEQSKRQETTAARDETATSQVTDKPIEQQTRDETYRNIAQEIQFFASISPEFKRRADDLMKMINKVLSDTIKTTKEETMAETIQEIEDRKCNDALILYNVHKMAYPQSGPCGFYDKVRPEEAVQHALKKMTRDLATIQSAVTLARTETGFPMTMKIVLGEPGQKGTLFRSLAAAKTDMPELYEMFRGVAFRDCFPHKYREEVKKMVAEGLDLKNNGEIAAFRVIARGAGCMPVLQKKERGSYRWSDHNRGQNRARRPLGDEQLTEDDKLINEMPRIFNKHAFKDPKFKKMLEWANLLGRSGKWEQADVEWKGEIDSMEEARQAFKGRPEVVKKMDEIIVDFTNAYDNWVMEYNDGEMDEY
jgi:hypothetical protein